MTATFFALSDAPGPDYAWLNSSSFSPKSRSFRVPRPARLEIAAQALQPRTFAPDTVLFQEGDKGEVLYILKEGIVKLFKIDLEGHEEDARRSSNPRNFSAKWRFSVSRGAARPPSLIRESKIYLLFKDDFQRLIKDYPSISLNVANTLSQRLHGMNDEAQILSYKDAQGRVAYVILRLYWGGLIDFNDQGQALLRLTHQELASLAGNEPRDRNPGTQSPRGRSGHSHATQGSPDPRPRGSRGNPSRYSLVAAS